MLARANEALWKGQINVLTDDIRALIVQRVYGAAYNFLSNIPVAKRMCTAQALAGRTTPAYVAERHAVVSRADDMTFASVGDSGNPFTGFGELIVYKHTGTESTSHVLSQTRLGGDFSTYDGSSVTVNWNRGAGDTTQGTWFSYYPHFSYPFFLKSLADVVTGGINWTTGTYRLVVLGARQPWHNQSGGPDVAKRYLGDIPTGERLATSNAIGGRTLAYSGSLEDTLTIRVQPFYTVIDVPVGSAVYGLAIYRDTGNVATSPLLFYYDTSMIGTPERPAGQSYDPDDPVIPSVSGPIVFEMASGAGESPAVLASVY